MQFDPSVYGDNVARVLALDSNGERLMPLVASGCASRDAHDQLKNAEARKWFANARTPEGAMAGLWLYFSCFEEAHGLAQDLSSSDGSYWHALVHRQEPDSGNAAYWFRRVGAHAIFPELVKETAAIVSRYPEAEFRASTRWDPFGFILFCERAREQPDSPSEKAALEIQRVEWQLLFDHCARPGS